jgi:hypothetical protein
MSPTSFRFVYPACALTLVIALQLFAVGTAPAGPRAESAASPSGSSHKSGRYQGKVGTFARIFFKAESRKVKKLSAGVQASCQRASDGQITRIQLVAMKTSKKLKVKSNGKFKGSGQEENDIGWKLKGRFVSKTKAKGTFEASQFIFNPFTFDSELCAGSGKWTAKLKR